MPAGEGGGDWGNCNRTTIKKGKRKTLEHTQEMNENRQLFTPGAKSTEAFNRYSEPSITKNNKQWTDRRNSFFLDHISIKAKVKFFLKVLGCTALNVNLRFPGLSLLLGNSEANFVLRDFISPFLKYLMAALSHLLKVLLPVLLLTRKCVHPQAMQ